MNWLRQIGAWTNTRKSYVIGMCFYCNFHNISTIESLEEAEEEIEAGILMRKRKIGRVPNY